jgi:hypothetical protein
MHIRVSLLFATTSANPTITTVVISFSRHVTHVIAANHLLLLLLIRLKHFLFMFHVFGAFLKYFIFCGGVPNEVTSVQESGSIERIAQLAFKLLAVEDIPDLVGHLSIGLVDVLPLCEGE